MDPSLLISLRYATVCGFSSVTTSGTIITGIIDIPSALALSAAFTVSACAEPGGSDGSP
eukprot:CAMPEP_0172542692 /NCGR_PEP_ID=MMETSP1067-20121228/13258_1 /TAXON_ID=265564 ORGANISM="Thalassiosira punctigera, Strain Tpunct2005C2" /NCGR_SAMPLE_ID=MMETSP1067 /ASSEMBLY_ACC=CAM_ASM_000444 /LENGTH=58 /DNA_ID=CAMNT_0013328979 /DNA_START=260 /DNA_END=433 /DNA_ORIENTATION=-